MQAPHTEAEDVLLVAIVKLGELLADLILGNVGAVRVDDIDDLEKEHDKGQHHTCSECNKRWAIQCDSTTALNCQQK